MHVSPSIMMFTLLRWSGTKPTVSLRMSVSGNNNYGGQDNRQMKALENVYQFRPNE